MNRAANAVLRLLECETCHGYIATGTCVCIKQKEENEKASTGLVATASSRLALKQNIGGAL